MTKVQEVCLSFLHAGVDRRLGLVVLAALVLLVGLGDQTAVSNFELDPMWVA